uniref:Uncharacterized protein n=1 Tax=Brugia malayi TaxID=6279 RepID=A8QHE0_BRUMA
MKGFSGIINAWLVVLLILEFFFCLCYLSFSQNISYPYHIVMFHLCR